MQCNYLMSPLRYGSLEITLQVYLDKSVCCINIAEDEILSILHIHVQYVPGFNVSLPVLLIQFLEKIKDMNALPLPSIL